MSQINQKKMNIKLDEKIGEGTYSNMFMMTFSNAEFILDFGRIVPGLPDARVYSRIITTPQHAKHFMKILQKNIEAFEKQHGEIKLPGKTEEKGIGFKSAGQNT